MRFSWWLCHVLPAVAFARSVVLERRPEAVEDEWTKIGPATAHESIELQIALTPRDQALLEQHLMEISDPSNSRWRQHLSPSEISSLLTPSSRDVDIVMQWLATEGVKGYQSHDMVTALATVDQVERLLECHYAVYEDTFGNRVIRTEQYSVPEHIGSRVDLITPTVHFPSISKVNGRDIDAQISKRSELDARHVRHHHNSSLIGPCGNGTYPHNTTVPKCVRAAYSVDWRVKDENTSFAIFNVDGGTWVQSNLQTYLEHYRHKAAKAHATFEMVNLAGYVPQPVDTYEGVIQTDGEIDGDTEVAMGLAWPARGVLFNANTSGIFGNLSIYDGPSASEQAAGQDYFLKFLHEMAHNETVVPVVSFSAGANEDMVPHKYARRACHLMAAASARGVTFVTSSGDQGPVAAAAYAHSDVVSPLWPTTCPYVLSVGATFNPFDEQAATSIAGAGFQSGGGFSNYYPRPKWQDADIPPYIENDVSAHFKTLSGFNASGRGYPDVSALGDDVPTWTSGEFNSFGGTSASAPLWAGLITILNDYEASRGRPTLGLIAPWLYSLKNGELRDITVGSGVGYAVGSIVFTPYPYPEVGYNATVGWDAITGLGVPVFDKLRAALP